MEPSACGDGIWPSVNRGGVGNIRWANKLTGEGANDKGEAKGEANEDKVTSAGEKIFDVH
jgi:hypothetical protein